MILTPDALLYQRKVYDFLMVLGDIGGVQAIFFYIIGLFCLPFSHFSYNLKVTKNLYKARTNDIYMFDQTKKTQKNREVMNLNKNIQVEIAKHYIIALKFKDLILLYLHQFMTLPSKFWKRRDKFVSLYK